MQEFMITLLTCSAAMSILALMYMAVTPILAKRYSVKGRYYAWLIIVGGLIIPFRPHFSNAFVKVDVPSGTATPIIQIGNGTPVTIPAENAVFSSAALSISWWQIATAVWLGGMIIYLTYHAVKHYRFTKMTGRWSEKIIEERTLVLLQNLKTEMDISKQINLYSCSSVGTPMMIGFVTPRILLPKTNIVQDELRFILKHELFHYKQKDLWYKCLILAATAVHWFNPIVYLMARAINVQCELSCDAEIVKSADADTRQYYSETIIGIVRYQSKLKTALSTNFYGGKKGMKKRISSIMDMSRKKTGVAIICGVLLVTLGTGFAFAANVNASQGGDTPTETQATIAERFSIYEQYGMTYNQEKDLFIYDNKIVRYFNDTEAGEGYTADYTKFDYADYNVAIDVVAVRDAAGKLTGLAPVSKEDFDLRTESFNELNNMQGDAQEDYNGVSSAENGNATEDSGIVEGGSGLSTEAGNPNEQDTALNEYSSYGVSYDGENKCWVYENKPIHYFSDGDYLTFSDYSEDAVNNGISLEVIRNTNGEIEKIVEVEYHG